MNALFTCGLCGQTGDDMTLSEDSARFGGPAGRSVTVCEECLDKQRRLGRCDHCHREYVIVEASDEVDGEPIFLCVDEEICKLAAIWKQYGRNGNGR